MECYIYQKWVQLCTLIHVCLLPDKQESPEDKARSSFGTDSDLESLEAMSPHKQQDKTAKSTSTGKHERNSLIKSDKGIFVVGSGWGSLEARNLDEQQPQETSTAVEGTSTAMMDEAKSSVASDKDTSAADSGWRSLEAMSLKERQDTAATTELTNIDSGKGISTPNSTTESGKGTY